MFFILSKATFTEPVGCLGNYRFPGQEHVAGNSKIPSIMYYDRHGRMKAAGAEADGASVLAQAEDEGWIKVELYDHFPAGFCGLSDLVAIFTPIL